MATAAQLERPVFLYDGDCSFCSSCADFIERRIPTGAEVKPWQFVDLDALGVTQAEAEEAVIWVPATAASGVSGSAAGAAPGSAADTGLGAAAGSGGVAAPTKAGPEAIARLLVEAGSFWRPLGWVLALAPVRWVAWPVYRLISRNRHRLPGGTAACSLPQAERDRQRAG